MIYSGKNILLLGFLLATGINSVHAVKGDSLFALITILATLQEADSMTPYRIHNLDHRSIDLSCKCGKSSCSQVVKRGNHAKISCAISSISASVVSENGITDDVSIFAGSPTDKTLTKYRTFQVTVGKCPSKHHQCGRNHKDTTTVFSRYFDHGDAVNATGAFDYYDFADQSGDYIDQSPEQLEALTEQAQIHHNLRGF